MHRTSKRKRSCTNRNRPTTTTTTTQQCKQIDRAVTAADKQLHGPLWLTADRLIAALGNTKPQILLPTELSDRIVDLKLPMFPPELWRMVAGYSVSTDEIRSERLQCVVFGRVVCLLLGGGNLDDGLLLFTALIADLADFKLYVADLVFRLFIVQQYDAAERICSIVLAADTDRTPRGQRDYRLFHNSEFSLFRSLSLSFLGRSADANRQINEYQYNENYGTSTLRFRGWNMFARYLAIDPPTKTGLNWIVQQFAGCKDDNTNRILAVMSTKMISNAPDTITADWLRTKHTEAITELGIGWIRKINSFLTIAPFPPFRSIDL